MNHVYGNGEASPLGEPEPNDDLDYSKIDNIKFDGIDTRDYPDFCDAYISEANYDGKPMTDEQLEKLNEDSCFVNERLMNHLY